MEMTEMNEPLVKPAPDTKPKRRRTSPKPRPKENDPWTVPGPKVNPTPKAHINKRKMITAGGIRYRAPRPSRATGKARGNCPTCGKITWDWNPYENAHCKHHEDDYDPCNEYY